MLTSPQITGIEPFSAFSTFICTGLSIPRGMFLGGCFYTAQAYEAPIHVSYINCSDEHHLSTWGIADATGKELAVVYFSRSSLVGDIIGLDGQYAGCIKARKYNYGGVAIGDNTGDLHVFLQGLSRDYTLNNDSLVWGIEHCSILAPNPSAGPSVAGIVLPEDCVLSVDATGAYYMAPNASGGATTALQRLILQGDSSYTTLSGTHISILPYCESAIVVSNGYVISGAAIGAAEDTLGAVVDGAVVIATHGGYPQ